MQQHVLLSLSFSVPALPLLGVSCVVSSSPLQLTPHTHRYRTLLSSYFSAYFDRPGHLALDFTNKRTSLFFLRIHLIVRFTGPLFLFAMCRGFQQTFELDKHLLVESNGAELAGWQAGGGAETT